MAVDDSDFYDFDKDKMEMSFKKGQVWAIYDDDDGMPRHYGLIDEIVSVNPFVVKMSWLNLQSNGYEGLICWEKTGIHISCGRFRVARKTSIDSVNVYSHLVDAERTAREVYRIYPKKGSVWALYKEDALDNEGRNLLVRDKRCYDIVLFLTSYSEIHGLREAPDLSKDCWELDPASLPPELLTVGWYK
ncbi:Small-conductance mechanosensitive channel MscMJ like [Actinidia chinensis var. chinensis]|uniref:Small-conductance mechanosensitive channel MscMJ like n=1 Tax=Actinidia chinensis var. chinensis TaxID=1590841 RepID=A0A2R6R221_ACTCC|nr:Small-conductance mechanosensitive channel MscMJ like [Actinidia chinensis var. chinensis]